MFNKDFRLRLTTRDGVLVMDRMSDKTLWTDKCYRGGRLPIPEDLLRILIEPDCRSKGVRLVSYTMHEDRLEGIVEWL